MLLQPNTEQSLRNGKKALIIKNGSIDFFVKGQNVDFVLDGNYVEGVYQLDTLDGLIIKYTVSTGTPEVELVGI